MEEAAPALRKILKTRPDLEIRLRVPPILEAISRKLARRGLAKAQMLGREGRVDEMVERLVLWRESDKGQAWKVVAELAGKLVEREEHDFGKTRFEGLVHMADRGRQAEGKLPLEGPLSKKLSEIWKTRAILCREENISLAPGDARLVLASENVTGSEIIGSVIVAGGDVELKGNTMRSVILCDGDFKAQSLKDCLVIARGTITCPKYTDHCVIISETLIDLLAAGGGAQFTFSSGGPNRFVKFFDPAAAGLKVRGDEPDNRQLREGVRIVEVGGESPFAGKLFAEDVITAIDEKKIPSMEVFRKILRRKLAEGGPIITFTVRREAKILDVLVPVRD